MEKKIEKKYAERERDKGWSWVTSHVNFLFFYETCLSIAIELKTLGFFFVISVWVAFSWNSLIFGHLLPTNQSSKWNVAIELMLLLWSICCLKYYINDNNKPLETKPLHWKRKKKKKKKYYHIASHISIINMKKYIYYKV